MEHNEENTQEYTKLPFYKSLRGKLLFWFLGLALIPLGIIGVLAYNQASTSLEALAANQLEAVQTIKRNQIEGYFAERESDMAALVEVMDALRMSAFDRIEAVQALKQTQLHAYFDFTRTDLTLLAADPYLWQAINDFNAAFHTEELRPGSLGWNALVSEYGAYIEAVRAINHWDDVLLICPNGQVAYTAQNNVPVGSDITTAEFAGTSLQAAFEKARLLNMGEVALVDFAPLNEVYKGFLMTPVRDHDDTLVGYVATEISIDTINEIVQERHGLGESGETYVITRDAEGRVSLRSDLVTMLEFNYVVGYDLTDTAPDYVLRALEGETGVELFVDTAGQPVLVAFEPLGVAGLDWAIITKLDASEAIVPQATDGSEGDLLTQYASFYGYLDLLLMNEHGYVFYSTNQGAELNTNMATGVYSPTNLGQLTRQILETQEYGVVDFASYPPDGNSVAAFIARPLVHNGHVEMIVAARLNIATLDAIMQERTGLGETGETYLVGSDYRMRSNSFLDPEARSVVASFAGTIADNGSDTEATRKALAGQAGVEIVPDYRGESVLSAYAPLDVAGLQWAIFADINTAEIFAPVAQLQNTMLGVGIVVIGVIVVLALWVANSLARPIVTVTETAQAVAGSNLEVEANVKSSDETGILAAAFNQMIGNLRQRIESEQAAYAQAAILAEADREQKLYLEETVDEYLSFIEQVSRGDLTGRLSVNGNNDALTRLGHYLNTMVVELGDMTAQIREATLNITTAAAEILAATTQQAAGANEQSSAISQTSTTIDQVKAIVEQAFAKAQAVAVQAQTTHEVSTVGRDSVIETIDGMSQIKERVEDIAENILSLSEQTQQISDIIATVNDIASQSNLLALNASVEAARAGVHGKGFAVVAVEVRNLAEQSKQATAQVKTILDEIQRATNDAVMATEEGTKGVDMGVRLTEQAGETIEHMTQSISQSTEAAQQIVASVQQQTTGIEQIVLAMQNINQATVQNLASTQQAEKAAQDLSAVSRQLENLVAQYKLDRE